MTNGDQEGDRIFLFHPHTNNTAIPQIDPYLGITFSDNMKWTTHINQVRKKANSILGFLRRNLHHTPQTCRKNAYLALVRSKMEYGSVIWDPYTKNDIAKLENVQRLAARFIMKDYHSRQEECVTEMLISKTPNSSGSS